MLPKVSEEVLDNFAERLGPKHAIQLCDKFKEEDSELYDQLAKVAMEAAEHISQLPSRKKIKQQTFINIMYLTSALRYVLDHQLECEELEDIYG